MWPRKIAAGRLESGARTYEKRYTDDESIDSDRKLRVAVAGNVLDCFHFYPRVICTQQTPNQRTR